MLITRLRRRKRGTRRWSKRDPARVIRPLTVDVDARMALVQPVPKSSQRALAPGFGQLFTCRSSSIAYTYLVMRFCLQSFTRPIIPLCTTAYTLGWMSALSYVPAALHNNSDSLCRCSSFHRLRARAFISSDKPPAWTTTLTRI